MHASWASWCAGWSGKLLGRNWTERLFVFARRLLGLRLKLMVLLVAEVVGGAFYGLLASRLPEGALRRGLEQICEDEEHHLDFHGTSSRGRGGAWWGVRCGRRRGGAWRWRRWGW